MEYKCKWCSEIKPEEQFVKRKASDPYSEQNIRCCKACNTEKNRQRYRDNNDVREKQLVANAKWRLEHKDRQRELEAQFNQRTPRNQKARNKVRHMVRRGYWTKQPCEVCGRDDYVEAHHDSYAEAHWTTVRWLCKQHHEQWHHNLDPVKNSILEEPLAKVFALREEHDEIHHQMADLRRRALAIKKEAEDLEFLAWSAVQKAASDMYPKVFKK